MLTFNQQLVQEQVFAQQKPALVEFWAPWCVYSLLLERKTEALSGLYGERVLVGRLNIENDMPFVKSLGIEFVPGLAFFQAGRLVHKWYGDLPLRAITDVIAGYEPLS